MVYCKHPFGGPQQVLRYLARYTHRVAISNRRLVAWSGELRHICKDGHEVIVDSRMQLLGDDTVLEVNRDITDAKALIARQASLPPNSNPFSTNPAFSLASWTWKATCAK